MNNYYVYTINKYFIIYYNIFSIGERFYGNNC